MILTFTIQSLKSTNFNTKLIHHPKFRMLISNPTEFQKRLS